MSQGVAITGMGIISAIGNNVAENFRSLVEGKKGITTISKINTIHKDVIKVGEIGYTNSQLEHILGLTPDNNYS